MSHDQREPAEDPHRAHEREEWTHSNDREHQWEAGEHARLRESARRPFAERGRERACE